MKTLAIHLSTLCSLLTFGHLLAATEPAFYAWVPTPVMGWNSWDFYGTSINEERTKAQADYMAANLPLASHPTITCSNQR